MTRSRLMSASEVFRLGFGTIDTRAIIGGGGRSDNIIPFALLANLPQLILSLLYFAFNGTFTAMLMGYEWISYAHKRKGLRVSTRSHGFQRSTYFLSLPYRYGLPLVVLSVTLHWIVSQCIFVVTIDIYDEFGHAVPYSSPPEGTRTCGYSPVAMVSAVILGVFMLAAVVGFGYIPYKSGMPLAASSSLAISAACHPDRDSEIEDIALSEQKLQWGVVSTNEEGIGHCAFSNKEVGPLVKGRMYA